MKKTIGMLAVLAAVTAMAAPVVKVGYEAAEKIGVAVDVANADFAKSLQRNLVLSGCFKLDKGGSVKVSGAVGEAIVVTGAGKKLTLPSSAADAAAARMEARRLSDRMCEVYANQRGFACDRVAFVSRKSMGVSELCVAYPDGSDISQLTSDGKSVVGPRWKDKDTILFTGLYDSGPQIFEINLATMKRKLRWSFKGLATGAAVSPDGTRVAMILSLHGNPELYVIDVAAGTWNRLTTTRLASEGQPSWSPDGREIAYVSDETRHPQLYVVDVATKKKRRITSKGSQNIDPDWGPDGRITYITKRDGQSVVAVMDPQADDRSAELVTAPGTWEHPSWARDGRHVVANRDKALFVVDTFDRDHGGTEPVQLFRAAGEWITPCWMKK